MSRIDSTQTTLYDLAVPVCEKLGVELVDVRLVTERGERIARVTIDRERTDGLPGSGIFLEDCQHVSRTLATLVDETPAFGEAAFRLEVSSPGVERPLVRPADFERFVGRETRIKTFQPLDGQRNFEGKLLGMDGANVRIECSGRVVLVPHESIAKANLVHRFDRASTSSGES